MIDLRTKCAVCGHAFSFHGKNLHTACRAMGCKGEDGHRCQRFHEPEPAAEQRHPVQS